MTTATAAGWIFQLHDDIDMPGFPITQLPFLVDFIKASVLFVKDGLLQIVGKNTKRRALPSILFTRNVAILRRDT